MTKARNLRTPLLVNGIYGVIVGLLLFFPSLGAAVFAHEVKDAAVVSGWGVDIIVVGLLSVVAAADVGKYGGLAWVFVFGLLISAVDLIFYWVGGLYTTRTALIPVVINVILAFWIWISRPSE